MPRGKRTVFTVTCAECNLRVGTVRLHKQIPAKGVTWKDHKREKFCNVCRKRAEMKLKEERHSS